MYAKVFSQIYDGTLCTKGPWQALVTFQQLLVLADQEGNVDMTPVAISRRTTIPVDIIELGITELLKADPESRTPVEEGRRIKPLSDGRSWGWQIVNYKHYRSMKREEDRREYHRDYWHKRTSKPSTDSTSTQQPQPSQPIEEAKAEADTEGKNTRVARAVASACPADVSPQVFEDWSQLRKAKKSPITKTALVGVRRQAEKAGLSMQQALEVCCERGWSGFKAEWITERSPVGRQAGVESRNAAVVARILKGGQSEQG